VVRQRAFTLVELLITLAVMAILLALASPSIRDALLDRRLAAATGALEADLLAARGAAVFGAVSTVACPGDTTMGCSPVPDWTDGWLVFEDRDGDREFRSGEPLLRIGAGVEGVTIRSSQARRRLRFGANGTAPGSNATLRICDERGTAEARQLRLSNSGRLRSLGPREGATVNCP
jgi:type IV fimbrial biogenesis protein FimT